MWLSPRSGTDVRLRSLMIAEDMPRVAFDDAGLRVAKSRLSAVEARW